MFKTIYTSSINKIKKLKFRNVLIAALDVESLYPNIDLKKDVKARKYYLNHRNNQWAAT